MHQKTSNHSCFLSQRSWFFCSLIFRCSNNQLINYVSYVCRIKNSMARQIAYILVNSWICHSLIKWCQKCPWMLTFVSCCNQNLTMYKAEREGSLGRGDCVKQLGCAAFKEHFKGTNFENMGTLYRSGNMCSQCKH